MYRVIGFPFIEGSHYKPCISRERERPCGPIPLVPIQLAARSTHFSYKDHDEPQAAGEDGQERIEKEAKASIVSHWFSFRRGLIYAMFLPRRAKTKGRVGGTKTETVCWDC